MSEQQMEVIHDTQNQRFVLTVDGEHVVSLYRMIDDNTIEFYSTFTPEPLRGNGYARIVVDQALAYARQNKLEIIPSCWYVKKILEQQQN